VAGTGLSWGYNGSGPVALAILLGLLLDDINAAAPRGYRYPQSPGLLVGVGAQLELSTALRDAMFAGHSRSRRKHTTTELFWAFVAVCRAALDQLEAEQIVVRPGLRCLES
jgi:hypothetical protein